MKYAFNTWAYSSYPSWLPAYPIDETVRRLARIGYDGIELGCAAPHAWPYYLDTQARRNIKKCADDNDIVFTMLLPAIGGGPGHNAASSMKAERDWTVKHCCDCCDLAAELGANKLLYVAGFYIYGQRKSDAWNYSLDSLRRIAEYAQGLNIEIVVEPTASDSNLVENYEDTLEMLRQAEQPNVKAMFDIAHALYRNEPASDYVYLLKDVLSSVHFTDAHRQAPGTNGYDFTDVFQALKEIQYDGYITMETGFATRDMQPDTAARQSLTFLKALEKQIDSKL